MQGSHGNSGHCDLHVCFQPHRPLKRAGVSKEQVTVNDYLSESQCVRFVRNRFPNIKGDVEKLGKEKL